MHLFKSDWLREPPRSVVGSYARRTYGARRVRHPEVDVDDAARELAGLWSPATVEIAPRPRTPQFDRAA